MFKYIIKRSRLSLYRSNFYFLLISLHPLQDSIMAPHVIFSNCNPGVDSRCGGTPAGVEFSACDCRRKINGPGSLVAGADLSQTRLACRQHDEPSLQVHAEDLANLEASILGVSGHQQEGRAQRILLTQLAVGGEVQHARAASQGFGGGFGRVPPHEHLRLREPLSDGPGLALGSVDSE